MKRLMCLLVAAACLVVGLIPSWSDGDQFKPVPKYVQANDSKPMTLPWADPGREPGLPGLQQFQFSPFFQHYYPPTDSFWRWSKNAPVENRGEEYRKWLRYSVRIRNGNVSGSGTICYYSEEKKTAWVISCGHLFHGGEKTCQIHVFYKNSEKLAQPQTFTATVLCFSPSQRGEDLSFMTFQPDWSLDAYAPIAKIDCPIEPGKTYYSCGCDGAREVACYLMKAKGLEGKNLVLTENGPRHGRSGGGLMTADGFFIGVCWGSSDPYNGTGKGYFVPLNRIHPYAKSNNLGWLLDVGVVQQSPARRLRIINWTGPQQQFPADYIPLPP